jgi:esterase/lipase superfamily enzyme
MSKSILFFSTNRNPIERSGEIVDYGNKFNPIHPQELRFGFVEINGTRGNPAKCLAQVATYGESVSKGKATPQLGSNAMFKDLAKKMGEGVPTLVFVHGYANTFQSALTAGISLQNVLRKDGLKINVVLFTWPSDGGNLYKDYFDDRQDASASGAAFVRGILKLKDFLTEINPKDACKQPIHLLCHSMGNYVLEKALREINIRSSIRFPRIFDEIILAAADIDYDCFEHDHKLARLPEICRRVSVYFNRGDKALAISDYTKGNPDRLGHKGPRKPLDVPTGVVLVDCSEAVNNPLNSEHGYFTDNNLIRADIVATLKGVMEADISNRKYVPSSNAYLINRPHKRGK